MLSDRVRNTRQPHASCSLLWQDSQLVCLVLILQCMWPAFRNLFCFLKGGATAHFVMVSLRVDTGLFSAQAPHLLKVALGLDFYKGSLDHGYRPTSVFCGSARPWPGGLESVHSLLLVPGRVCPFPNALEGKHLPGPLMCGAGSHSSHRGTLFWGRC